MKKLLIAIIGASFLFTGCLKDEAPNDFSTVGTIIEIPYAGLGYFSSAALIFSGTDPVTLNFDVNIASPYPLSSDLTVTLGVDDSKRTAYNSSSDLQYEAMPSDHYSYTATSATIAAGSRIAHLSITFYPDKFDPAKSIMLPISITDAQGNTISGNQGTIYYHYIGMDLAGTYDLVGTRTNYIGSVSGGVISSVTDLSLSSPKTLLPISPEQGQLGYANLISLDWYYLINYDPTTKTITSIEPAEVMASGISANSFVDYEHEYDPSLQQIHLLSEYTNTSGNARLVDETLTKQ